MSAKDQQEPLLGEGAHPQEEEQPGGEYIPWYTVELPAF